jgi:hypothetical protein
MLPRECEGYRHKETLVDAAGAICKTGPAVTMGMPEQHPPELGLQAHKRVDPQLQQCCQDALCFIIIQAGRIGACSVAKAWRQR